MEDVCLMKEHIGPNVKIKAAGGIRSKEDMEQYIRGRMQQDWYKQCNFHAAGRRIRWICQN